MTDPVTATLLIGTIVGGTMKAVGSYQTEKAAAAASTAEAGYAGQFASAEETAAQTTKYAGYRAQETTERQYGAVRAREAVTYGAGNIAGRTTQDVNRSIVSIGRQAGAETFNRYALTAEQEQLKGAEYRTTQALKTAAAGQESTAADIALVGGLAETAGQAAGSYIRASSYAPTMTSDATPVNPKWYANPDSPAGRVIYGSSIYG